MKADRRVTAEAIRQRHLRARRRKGLRVAKIEVDEVVVVEALVDQRLLRRCDADDWAKVEAALEKGLQVVLLIEP